ncbi:choice-of-anchor J domain-containing protein [Micromonospora sp. DPT]|uniref:choice-of-anchor J domain-containing protein n=1 Tax=Micromonospora sp. DPT TaxID=3142975 RepID=UPI003209BD27
MSVEGPSGVSDYTTPANGRYSFKLPTGATYSVKVEAKYPGYQTVTKEVVVGSGDVTNDVAVPVNTNACTTAPGYRYGSDGVYQTFDGTTVPAGWSVVDHLGTGQIWEFTDTGARGNLTGGTGNFAVIDSDNYGSSGRQDTSLVSPVVDLTGVAAPVVRFNQDYNWLGSDRADVDLSLDGGTTWTNVLRQAADVRGPRVTEVPIPQAAGQAQARVRFHYYDAQWEWWWQVDNVLIGSEVNCEPTNGGLVLGHVRDKNDDGYVKAPPSPATTGPLRRPPPRRRRTTPNWRTASTGCSRR